MNRNDSCIKRERESSVIYANTMLFAIQCPRILLIASATLKRDRMQPSEKAVRARSIMIARQKLGLEPNSEAGRVTDKEWEAALNCSLSAGKTVVLMSVWLCNQPRL